MKTDGSPIEADDDNDGQEIICGLAKAIERRCKSVSKLTTAVNQS